MLDSIENEGWPKKPKKTKNRKQRRGISKMLGNLCNSNKGCKPHSKTKRGGGKKLINKNVKRYR
jgi:hypothetical protein